MAPGTPLSADVRRIAIDVRPDPPFVLEVSASRQESHRHNDDAARYETSPPKDGVDHGLFSRRNLGRNSNRQACPQL